MEKRQLGTSKIDISPIVMGTWQAGKRGWVGIDDSEIIQALQAAVTAGITTFDTAEIYGDGYSEKLLGQALTGIREQVVLATKVFANHLKYEQVIAACDRSLVNLRTDYIDLYQIHWPTGAFGNEIVLIEETMRALQDLKTQGKIRSIGVSNFSGQQLAEASKFARIDSLQPPYSLFWRYVETDALPYCQANQISILAYSPMAQGLLTGKFAPSHKFPPTDNRSQNKLFQGENYQRAQLALEQLRPLGAELNCTLGQLALAWVIAQPQTVAIAGARNSEQVRLNAQAVDVKLSESQLHQIDAIARQVTDGLGTEAVMWNWN
jgi:aryl-alcohol dehydrogenase-like predicted oxidoreductase